MLPRWESWLAVLALHAASCAIHQRQEVVVIVQREEPLRGYATGPLSLGEAPSDLSAAQINHALEGHGTWLDSAAYGRIWRPNDALVGGTFAPYSSAGQWVATGVGWYWQSDYAWGRVPFHYGRWVLDGSLWSWVPGSRFAPAWVDWRVGGGWVAWAPLAPIGSRRRAPFVYCSRAGLNGLGLAARLVRGPAASSLYTRTETLGTDGIVPRGPVAEPADGVGVAVAQVWNTSPHDPAPTRSAAVLASVEGVESVAPIPVALIREELPGVDSPAGGSPVVIRDRDVAGVSAGPSVRRPDGVIATLPGPVYRPRVETSVMETPRASSALPPPLPPPPDGVGPGSYPGTYPARLPMGFASGRSRGTAPAIAEPSTAVGPSQQPVAQPRPVLTTGRWLGPTAADRTSPPPAEAPLNVVQ